MNTYHTLEEEGIAVTFLELVNKTDQSKLIIDETMRSLLLEDKMNIDLLYSRSKIQEGFDGNINITQYTVSCTLACCFYVHQR